MLKEIRMDTKRKGHFDPKRPTETNCPLQLQTHYVPTNDVENTNTN